MLSGIMNVNGGRASGSTHAEGHAQTGHVVAPQVNAPNQQHFFSYRNSLGQFTGYTLVPGAATPAFARPGSAPMRTAGFIAHQLWVTPSARP